MFDQPNLPKIETPPGVKSDKNKPEIFSMPEKFRGLAGKVTPLQVKPAATTPLVIPKKPLPPPKPLQPLKKSRFSKTTKILLISGTVLIIALGSAAVYVYVSLRPVEQVTKPVVQVNTAPPKVETPVVVEPPVEPPVEPKEETPAEPFPTGTQPGRDSDSDGLSDAEELLYRTNSRKPDSDSDGFLDGNEVFHGYDPNAGDLARLSDSTLVGSYAIDRLYLLYYPLAWQVVEDSTNLGNVLFVVPSGEMISISLEEKAVDTSIADWFSGTAPASDVLVSSGATKQGYRMLETENRMTVYIDAGDKVIIMNYQNTVKASIDYLATFEMMMNTLVLPEVYVESRVE